ncbi:sulfite exporter TauE/SafE family protein [Sphingosinicella rhizophila]|uniref:Probable membrane transporter protein n=1 Tax=Sphingosinicella rhizophila TaxID=3050082 RepID=A0ABU3Q4V5_9SPHN|nr:sulfite exporter TauE/SafE family protein [Sphingosinicella sp. GR2756]MDT9598421.1 sulfite exporter TauE/SafE family protein [Sphingosinicella sp. GR2756]
MFDFSGVGLMDLLPFIAIGFAAQMVDGALGMAFGVISTTLLISLGVPPATASAGVHTVETFTTGVSGVSHVLHKNVDWKLFARIVIPGVIGGIIGAYALTQISAETARPFVLVYLAGMGVYLLWRGATHRHTEREPKIVEPLGLIGGFLDAAGGGGWGPVVTSNLLVQGASPRRVIGTVNTAEFFLTVTISATFLFALGWEAFTIATVGLLIGGVIAAPIGALMAKRVAPDLLLTIVGVVLSLTSLYGLYRALT